MGLNAPACTPAPSPGTFLVWQLTSGVGGAEVSLVPEVWWFALTSDGPQKGQSAQGFTWKLSQGWSGRRGHWSKVTGGQISKGSWCIFDVELILCFFI